MTRKKRYTPPSTSVVLNQLQQEVVNTLRTRNQFLKTLMEGKRDIDAECGYPPTEQLTAETYKAYYDREGLAARVVNIFPDQCWKHTPEIFETNNSNQETEFEKAWDGMCQSVRGDDPEEGVVVEDIQQGNPVWKTLHRADRLCGIGHYGVIYLAFNDGLPLDQPAFGIDTDDDPGYMGTDAQYDQQGSVTFDTSSPNSDMDDDEDDDVPQEGDRVLLFMRPLDESMARITSTEARNDHRRFGLPIMYDLTLQDQSLIESTSTQGNSAGTSRVHWTRVIHVTDQQESSEVYHVPRMRPVFNRLIDARKVYGSSSEGYWKNAFQALVFETQSGLTPQNTEMLPEDKEALKQEIDLFQNSLQRALVTTGFNVKPISPQLTDPSAQLRAIIENICITIPVPMRIFMGSERGELASSQDKDSHDEVIQGRMKDHCTFSLIIPFVSRLVLLRVLPQPKSVTVEWPPVSDLSEEKKTSIAGSKTEALSKYIASGLDALIAPLDFLVEIMGIPEQKAKEILENALDHLEDANPDAEPGEVVAGRNPKPPQPDPVQKNLPAPPDQDPNKPDPKQKIPAGTQNAAKKKSKAGAKGFWRTGDDGQRLFIVPGQGAFAGGPGGPKLGGAADVKDTKPSAIDRKIAQSKTKAPSTKKTTPAPSVTPKKKEKEKPVKASGSADWDKASQTSQDMNDEWRANGNPKDLKMHSHAIKLSGKYTKEQSNSLNEYSSSMYTEINGHLRNGTVGSAKPSMQDRIKNIQSAASQKLKEPVVTYRGIDNKRAKDLLKSGSMQAEGFVSSSLSKGLATAFAEPGAGSIHLLEIRAKTGASVESISRFPGEFEIVQAHGTKYRVLGSRKESVRGLMKSSNATIITLEEV